MAIPSYEPIDAEQDLNDSGLYEKLDFRTMKNCHEYDNKGNNDYNDVMMIKIMNKYHFQYLPRMS